MNQSQPSPTKERQSATATETSSAPPAPRLSGWQRAKFLLRAIEVRLRFIALFVGIGLLMAYWTTIEAYWDRWTRPASAASADDPSSEYYCPMHPSVVRPGLEPNGAVPNCPICGMPLSKRKKGAPPELAEGVLARVQLSPERVQLAGVKTAVASYMPLAKEVRTVGYVAYDEARQSEIVTRVGGYLEKLLVDKTFDEVKRGQPLAEVYSPDLYSGVQELLLAKKHGAEDLASSARRRLKLLGVDDADIDEAINSAESGTRLVIRSPQSGQVIEKNVVQGASVAPGAVLFKVADLSTVWIEADVYERDLPLMEAGQEIEATVEALPGETFTGEIALVYPQLNVESRTNRVRVLVDNPQLRLRPGMFATVRVRAPLSEAEPFKSQIADARRTPPSQDDAAQMALQQVCPVTGKKLGSMGAPLKVSLDDRSVFLCCAGCETPLMENLDLYRARLATPPEDAVLSIPEQAVIDTGTQQVVYVEREPGVFEGVEVELGPRTGGYYGVIRGLRAGDRVAAAGSFLLDAETRLNPAAASAYFGASGSSQASGERDGADRDRAAERAAESAGLSAAQLEQIDKLPPEDRDMAIAQAVCPITAEPLGSMGPPFKAILEGEPVFLCCQGCERSLRERPKEALKKIKTLKSHLDAATPEAKPAAPAPVHKH